MTQRDIGGTERHNDGAKYTDTKVPSTWCQVHRNEQQIGTDVRGKPCRQRSMLMTQKGAEIREQAVVRCAVG